MMEKLAIYSLIAVNFIIINFLAIYSIDRISKSAIVKIGWDNAGQMLVYSRIIHL